MPIFRLSLAGNNEIKHISQSQPQQAFGNFRKGLNRWHNKLLIAPYPTLCCLAIASACSTAAALGQFLRYWVYTTASPHAG